MNESSAGTTASPKPSSIIWTPRWATSPRSAFTRSITDPGDWPIGAMGAAVLVASETAKLAGLSLARDAGSTDHFTSFLHLRRRSGWSLRPTRLPAARTWAHST